MEPSRLQQLERQLYENPEDDAPWYVYADALEASDDPGARWLRDSLAGQNTYNNGEHCVPYFGELAHPSVGFMRMAWSQPPRSTTFIQRLSRGPNLELNLASKAAQLLAAERLPDALERCRLLAFGVAFGLSNPLRPELAEVLRALPLLTLGLHPIPGGSAPMSFGDLPCLRALSTRNLLVNQPLPEGSAPQLDTLITDYGGSLATVDALPLRRLNTYVHSASDLEKIGRCTRLHTLAVQTGNFTITDLRPLRALPLRTLSLDGKIGRKSLAALAEMEALEVLGLRYVDEELDLGPISKLPNLREIVIHYCKAPLDLRPLARLPSLRSAWILDSPNVDHLDALRSMPDLGLDWSCNVRV